MPVVTREQPVGVRIADYLARFAQRGDFDWGTNHCCHYAAGWVREEEGLDAMPLVPTPDARAAWRLIASYGGLAEAITQQLGREPIAPAFAQAGDVVMMPLPEGRASVGICNGRTSLLITSDGAFLSVDTLQASHAWRVRTAAP